MVKDRESLAQHVNEGNRVKYVFFWGHKKHSVVSKSCFSQWYDSPFEAEGNRFLTAEHYMMYRKAILFSDAEAASRLLKASNPGEAKSIGREVRTFDQATWEASRYRIVVEGNLQKFRCHADLGEFLINTGSRVLVEASPTDRIWGIGLSEDQPEAQNPNLWRGLNLLGFALMEVRHELSK
ncbi:MAG: NADAR family protein [Pseudomonadota bacterium]